MPEKEKEKYMLIDDARIDAVCEAYFKWKDLNSAIKNINTRGINMPDVISEPMGCYSLGLLWNRGSAVGDATNPETNEKVEFKATSSFDGDLSSFGPKCKFDDLVFLRFKIDDNVVFIYDLKISSTDLGKYQANKKETVEDQKEQGRRPHIRLKEMFVDALDLKPTAIFDIRRIKVYKPEDPEYKAYIQE